MRALVTGIEADPVTAGLVVLATAALAMTYLFRAWRAARSRGRAE